MKIRRSLITLALLTASLAAASPADAALLAYEPFNYGLSSGTSPLNGKNGGYGFDAPWEAAAGNNVNWDTRPLPANVLPPSSGNQAELTNAGNFPKRQLDTSFSLAADGVLYFSFAMRKFGSNDRGGFRLINYASGNEINIGYDGVFPTAGTTLHYLSGNAGINYANPVGQAHLALANGSNYFIVGKVVASAAGTDEVYTKIYNVTAGDLAHAGDGLLSGVGAGMNQWSWMTTGNASWIIDAIMLQGDDGFNQYDELRLGTSWDAVTAIVPTPAALPASLALIALGAMRRRR